MSTFARPSAVLAVRPPYDLLRSLSCGQAFRWRCEGPSAAGIFAGRRVRLEQTPAGIVVDGLGSDADLIPLRRYLGLDEPLAEIEATLRRDAVLQRILPHTSGIALLRQDPWECLVSFLVSAFNNIPKIELTLHRLAEQFGELEPDGTLLFPPPQSLACATNRQLRSCLLGYRAPYLLETARRVSDGRCDLAAPARLAYQDARAMLLALPGVGEKVADCVLLFAYGKGEAFPVDVWVKRAVERWYFGGRRRTERQIRAFARQRFGTLAGYAQQHLFYYIREHGRRRQFRQSTFDVRPTSVPRSGRLPRR